MTTNNRIQVIIHDKFLTYITTDKQTLSERSNLLKTLFENYSPDNPLKISLERPEKSSIIFHYLETGQKSEELTNTVTFASYINDVIYMGIQDLQNHLTDMLKWSVRDFESNNIDFEISRPKIEFMEDFLEKNQGFSSFGYCDLILNWVGEKQGISKGDVERLTKYVKFDALYAGEINYFKKYYPEAFEMVMPAKQAAMIESQLVRVEVVQENQVD